VEFLLRYHANLPRRTRRSDRITGGRNEVVRKARNGSTAKWRLSAPSMTRNVIKAHRNEHRSRSPIPSPITRSISPRVTAHELNYQHVYDVDNDEVNSLTMNSRDPPDKAPSIRHIALLIDFMSISCIGCRSAARIDLIIKTPLLNISSAD